MELELVPLEGEKKETQRLLPPGERERMKARIKPIKPEVFEPFTDEQQHEMKMFLYRLIALSENIHHDMEDLKHIGEHEEHMMKLHTLRRALFAKASPAAGDFIKIIDISPMEPWLAWEVFVHSLQGEVMSEYYETKNTAGEAVVRDNPNMMQVDDNCEDKQMERSQKGRLTPHDIERYIFHFGIYDLVKHIIHARKIISGTIWEGDYDL